MPPLLLLTCVTSAAKPEKSSSIITTELDTTIPPTLSRQRHWISNLLLRQCEKSAGRPVTVGTA